MSINVEYIETGYGKEAVCSKCGSSVNWQECWNCFDGYSHHDCGEDTCCCIYPRPNVKCEVCNGEGGWFVCISCNMLDNKENIHLIKPTEDGSE